MAFDAAPGITALNQALTKAQNGFGADTSKLSEAERRAFYGRKHTFEPKKPTDNSTSKKVGDQRDYAVFDKNGKTLTTVKGPAAADNYIKTHPRAVGRQLAY